MQLEGRLQVLPIYHPVHLKGRLQADAGLCMHMHMHMHMHMRVHMHMHMLMHMIELALPLPHDAHAVSYTHLTLPTTD